MKTRYLTLTCTHCDQDVPFAQAPPEDSLDPTMKIPGKVTLSCPRCQQESVFQDTPPAVTTFDTDLEPGELEHYAKLIKLSV